MKTPIALIALSLASTAFAHDSTVPHLHPHGASPLPDYLTMLVAAALVACGIVAFRLWKKERRR